MAFLRWPWVVRRGLLPLLVWLLGLGHACEVHAYDDHAASPGDAAPVGHDHDGNDQALGCDAVLAVPAQGVDHPGPDLVMAMPASAPTVQAASAGAALEVRPAPPSTGPPLFLLFSSFLI